LIIKEHLKQVMKKRQYRSNQGRSPEKEEQIFNVLKVGFIALIVATISCIILN
jgi:hypothetical protein